MITPKKISLNGYEYTPQTIANFTKTATNEKEKCFFQEVVDFLHDWFADAPTITVQTSGSTGTPKPLRVEKTHMKNSAKMTCSYFNITSSTQMLLCMPVCYIAGKMMLVRALVSGCSLWVVTPSGRPFEHCAQMVDFVALVPMQVYNSLQHEIDRERLASVSQVLIGGGAIDNGLAAELDNFRNNFYSSYGMTETVSHIALRIVNGSQKGDWYTPLPEVFLSLSPYNTLCIDAPLVCSTQLQTNDIVEMKPDGRFKIVGRLDNVINSGGVKLQIEEMEQKIAHLISAPYAITYRTDARLGQAVVLLVATRQVADIPSMETLSVNLLPYELPLNTYMIEELPLTETKKVKRKACHEIAEKLSQQN